MSQQSFDFYTNKSPVRDANRDMIRVINARRANGHIVRHIMLDLTHGFFHWIDLVDASGNILIEGELCRYGAIATLAYGKSVYAAATDEYSGDKTIDCDAIYEVRLLTDKV